MFLFSIPLTFPVIALALLYVVGCVLTEVEWFGWTTVALIASVACVQFFDVFNIFAYVRDHAAHSALLALGYIVIGVIWSFVKWLSYLFNYRNKFRELKRKFLESRKLPYSVNEPVPDNLTEEFSNYLKAQYYYGSYSGLRFGTKPKAVDNKKKLVGWASFWFCSMLSTFLNDPVRKLYNFLFNAFKDLYQKMSDWVFSKDQELK